MRRRTRRDAPARSTPTVRVERADDRGAARASGLRRAILDDEIRGQEDDTARAAMLAARPEADWDGTPSIGQAGCEARTDEKDEATSSVRDRSSGPPRMAPDRPGPATRSRRTSPGSHCRAPPYVWRDRRPRRWTGSTALGRSSTDPPLESSLSAAYNMAGRRAPGRHDARGARRRPVRGYEACAQLTVRVTNVDDAGRPGGRDRPAQTKGAGSR